MKTNTDLNTNTAVIIGATGAVGNQLVNLLLSNETYQQVHIVVRKPTGMRHDKLVEHVVDFDNIGSWPASITGNRVFICIGTTLKQAGSKLAQQRIDVDYPVQFARLMKERGANALAVVSSIGADASGNNFYLQLKASLESQLIGIGFEHLVIIRPSVLDAERHPRRIGESIALWILSALAWMPWLKKYRPVKPIDVASSLINTMEVATGVTIVESQAIPRS